MAKNMATIQMARALKKDSRTNKAPIWARLAELALKPSSAKRVINVNRVAQLTKDGDMVAFPGKVLGTGNISHKITLFAFSVSNTAAKKIIMSGGKILDQNDAVGQNPSGTGVVLLG